MSIWIFLWHTLSVKTSSHEHLRKGALWPKKGRQEDTEMLQSRAPWLIQSHIHLSGIRTLWLLGYKSRDLPEPLARRVRDKEGLTNEAQFRGQWRKRFSVCLPAEI